MHSESQCLRMKRGWGAYSKITNELDTSDFICAQNTDGCQSHPVNKKQRQAWLFYYITAPQWTQSHLNLHKRSAAADAVCQRPRRCQPEKSCLNPCKRARSIGPDRYRQSTFSSFLRPGCVSTKERVLQKAYFQSKHTLLRLKALQVDFAVFNPRQQTHIFGNGYDHGC